jgi:hypothetical protein
MMVFNNGIESVLILKEAICVSTDPLSHPYLALLKFRLLRNKETSTHLKVVTFTQRKLVLIWQHFGWLIFKAAGLVLNSFHFTR